MTSPEPGPTRPTSAQAFQTLVPVMAPGRLNDMVGALERELVGADRDTALARVRDASMSLALLDAALTVRRDVGRLNDLIHALAIGLALERILEPGETITATPSLAAGNDAATQQFDLLTDVRAAEFKLSVWTGHDSQRQRGLFGDLVNLAAHTPAGLRGELYVVGPRPIRWLTSTKALVSWALNGASTATRTSLAKLDAAEGMAVPEFYARFSDRVGRRSLRRHRRPGGHDAACRPEHRALTAIADAGPC